MKRFYTMVSVSAVQAGNHFAVALDGKHVKVPSGAELLIPGRALAEAVAAEWAAQGERIDPETMPLTQLCTTAQDLVGRERPQMSAAVLGYLDTDLICYRTAQPEALAARQAALWDPFLADFAKTYGGALQITTGLAALAQDPKAHEAVANRVAVLDDLEFTVLQLIVPLTGSLVMGLAFLDGQAGPEQLYAASQIEEDYRAEIYNEALHGAAPQQEKRQSALRRDLEAAQLLLSLREK